MSTSTTANPEPGKSWVVLNKGDEDGYLTLPLFLCFGTFILLSGNVLILLNVKCVDNFGQSEVLALPLGVAGRT